MKQSAIIMICAVIVTAAFCTQQTADTGREGASTRCCRECLDSWAKSPAAIGPEGAICGRFMTASRMSDSCRNYFGKNPMTVRKCEKPAGTR